MGCKRAGRKAFLDGVDAVSLALAQGLAQMVDPRPILRVGRILPAGRWSSLEEARCR
jgi:hypothetical protein